MKHRPSKLICRIDVTGFLAIMLFFYVLLGLAASAHPFHRVPVDLPKADHSVSLPNASRDDALVIFVLRDGGIYFAAQRLSREELTRKISERIHHGAPARVFIQADARCKHLAVEQVLDAVRAAGVEKIAFLTK